NLTWRYSLAPGDQQYASAVVANRVVYSGSADGKLYALEADTGALRWRYDGAEPIDSTPAIYNGRVFFGTNGGRVVALDEQGTSLWNFAPGGAINASPVVSDDAVFVASSNGRLSALDPATGREIWFRTTSDAITSSPALDTTRLYAATERGR